MKASYDWMFGIKSTPLIVSNLMYLIVLGFTMTMGVVQGFLYGMADIEDISNKFLMFEVLQVFETYLLLPIAMYVGAICGFMFVAIR